MKAQVRDHLATCSLCLRTTTDSVVLTGEAGTVTLCRTCAVQAAGCIERVERKRASRERIQQALAK